MPAREISAETVAGDGAELIEFRTILTAGEVTRAFRETLERRSSRVEFSRIDSQSARRGEADDAATFSALCTLDASINGWAVQLHVFDHGDHRDVRIVILGTGGIARMFGGVPSYSRAAGRSGAARVMETLRGLDAELSLL